MSRPAGAENLVRPEDLIAAGLAREGDRAALERVAARYSIAVTGHLAALIDRSDPDDPIARQFVPDPRELDLSPVEIDDPIGDEIRSPCPGIVHRYPDRVLLKLLTVCPVYCRFCFRRESVGAGKGGLLSPADFSRALAYIAARPRLWEVVLTGGDPLALSPRRLGAALEALAGVGHLGVLRLHSRVPVAAPELLSPELLQALARVAAAGKTLCVAVHANHPRELSPQALAGFARLRAAGALLVSQSVLLRGVNDDVATLDALMRAFVRAGVKPYYLHHPDLAPGTAHFRVPLARGRTLFAALGAGLSGLARPAYVIDIPGGHGKIAADGAGVEPLGTGRWRLRDPAGVWRDYIEDEAS